MSENSVADSTPYDAFAKEVTEVSVSGNVGILEPPGLRSSKALTTNVMRNWKGKGSLIGLSE
jgi:hypothetical protein